MLGLGFKPKHYDFKAFTFNHQQLDLSRLTNIGLGSVGKNQKKGRKQLQAQKYKCIALSGSSIYGGEKMEQIWELGSLNIEL